jgi:hypothetical protein
VVQCWEHVNTVTNTWSRREKRGRREKKETKQTKLGINMQENVGV